MVSRALRGNEVILRRAVYAEFSLNEMRLLGNPLQQSKNPKRPFECPDLFYRDVSRTNFNTQYKNPNRTVIARTEDVAMAMYWLIFLNVHFLFVYFHCLGTHDVLRSFLIKKRTKKIKTADY